MYWMCPFFYVFLWYLHGFVLISLVSSCLGTDLVCCCLTLHRNVGLLCVVLPSTLFSVWIVFDSIGFNLFWHRFGLVLFDPTGISWMCIWFGGCYWGFCSDWFRFRWFILFWHGFRLALFDLTWIPLMFDAAHVSQISNRICFVCVGFKLFWHRVGWILDDSGFIYFLCLTIYFSVWHGYDFFGFSLRGHWFLGVGLIWHRFLWCVFALVFFRWILF